MISHEVRVWVGLVCLFSGFAASGQAQSVAGTSFLAVSGAAQADEQSVVPHVIKFAGRLQNLEGKPINGPVEVTFSLYTEEAGGTALWFETQTVTADSLGRYSVLLGAMTPQGLPIELFTAGEAHWLGVQVANLPEQSRVLLVSVPYALMAGNAETLGGKPASAYMLASQAGQAITEAATAGTLSGLVQSRGLTTSPGSPTPLTVTATQNYIPIMTDNAGSLGNSVMYQSGSFVGFNTTSPSFGIDLNSNVFAIGPKAALPGRGGSMRFRDDSATVRWLFGVPGTAGSQDFFMYNYTNGHAPIFIQNSAPSYALYLHANGNVGIGTTSPAYKLDVAGNVKSSSTVTGAQLVSTVSTGTPPLTVASTTQVANLNASLLGGFVAAAFQPAGTYASLATNTFGGTQTVTSGDLSVSSGDLNLPATSSASAGVINLADSPFIHACCSPSEYNTFLGLYAGNFTTTGNHNTATGSTSLLINSTGSENTADGYYALRNNSSGNQNTASGSWALSSNTTGNSNTANGIYALFSNTTGLGNTAMGYGAGVTNTNANANVTGSHNTFIGYNSGPGTSTALTNATALGANALVSQSNSLVLGNGVNVGIGTSTPSERLDVSGNVHVFGLLTVESGKGGVTVDSGSVTASLFNGPAADLACTGCVGNTALNVNYAGSASKGGAASNALLLNGLASSAFQPAGSYATLGSNSFGGTQTITSGNLSLPQTINASTGIVNMGGFPFIHACCAATQYNTFVGLNAGNLTTTGSGNTASGNSALFSNTSGSGNTASGYQALLSNTTGISNTATGYKALLSNVMGSDNTASGYQALYSNSNGLANTASGYRALFNNTDAFDNTAIGYGALYENCSGVPTGCTASENIGLGVNAGASNVTGAHNTFLGAYSGTQGTGAGAFNNSTAVGFGAVVSASNVLVLGGAGENAVNVGIGVTAPVDKLQVSGDIRLGTGGINGCVKRFDGTGILGICSSDARLKTDIEPFTPTLTKLVQLRPVNFSWRAEEFPEMHFGTSRSYGLIAQEVEGVFPDMVGKEEHGYKTVDYTRLPLLLLQAVRELKSENDGLREQIQEQEAQIRALSQQLEQLQKAQR